MAARKKTTLPKIRTVLPPNKRHKSKKDYDRAKEKAVKDLKEVVETN